MLFFHREDGASWELGGVDDLAYAYLMTMGEIPDQYPMSSSLITYVQPELVMVDQDRAASTDGYGYVVTSEVATEVAASFPSATGAITPDMAEETPPWVSVLARYVDEKRGDLTNLIRADYELGADPDEQAYVKGVEKALRHLDGVVSKYVGGSS